MIREVFAYKERKEMTDRLMAKDLNNFKDNTNPYEENSYGDTGTSEIPIEEAQEEIENAS